MKNSIIMHERTSSRWRNCIFWKPYGDAGLDISFCSHSMSNFMWALKVYLAQEYVTFLQKTCILSPLCLVVGEERINSHFLGVTLMS